MGSADKPKWDCTGRPCEGSLGWCFGGCHCNMCVGREGKEWCHLSVLYSGLFFFAGGLSHTMQPVPARWAQDQVAAKPPRFPAPGSQAPGRIVLIQASQMQGVTRLIQCCKFAVLLEIFFNMII